MFFEGLQPQNVLIMFLFSMKHSYLLTAEWLHFLKRKTQGIICNNNVSEIIRTLIVTLKAIVEKKIMNILQL